MKKLKQKRNQKLTEPAKPGTLQSSTELPQAQISTPKRLSCHNLQLNRFIDALVDDIMSPNLRLQWNVIREEYHVLLNGNSISGMYRVYAEIVRLQAYIAGINAAVQQLRLWYVQETVDLLREQGFDYGFTLETMIADLDSVIARSQTESVELEQQEDLWNQEMKKNAGNKPTRDYFGGWLDAISQHNGYRERASDITVSDFCRQINAMLTEARKAKVK